jgi:uncharacterized protein (DUF2336 family)
MWNVIKSFFIKKPKAYEEQKDILHTAETRRRMSLAADTATNKEILYYLAEKDPDPKVRQAVAENQSMPLHVSPVLAMDSNADVRLALAARLVDLLPELSQDKHSQLYAYAVQALGTLALDEVLKIRTALSSTLKDHAHTPPKIAGQLARDVEREVSEPILRFCAALSDDDLLDILRSHPAGWVVQAVACRDSLSAPISDAVIETYDRPGGRLLLENQGAQIALPTLHRIVEKAREFTEWQKPVVLRKTLPLSIARELAQFVDASVRDLLMRRGDFDSAESEEIAVIFRRRMDFSGDAPPSAVAAANEDPALKLKKLLAQGALTEEIVSDAMAMRDRAFLVLALAHMAETNPATVEKILAFQAPKSIVALCWKAGLSMRVALQMQRDIGQVPPKELIYPKGGIDYPFTRDELIWQLEFLGLKAA